jgi:hypothetical protein
MQSFVFALGSIFYHPTFYMYICPLKSCVACRAKRVAKMVRAAQDILRSSSKLTEENVKLAATGISDVPVAASSPPSTSPLFGRYARASVGAMSEISHATSSPTSLDESVMPMPKDRKKKGKNKRKVLESSEKGSDSDSDADWLP